ncbi:hypothetical protein GCM10018952_24240 [Streptosporangium vulgare]
MIPYRVPPVRQLGPARLTAGLEDCRRMDLAEHRDMHGTAPSMSGEELAALADEVDMRGRGGAAFPFARKVRAVMDKKADKVVLVNAAEASPRAGRTRCCHAPGPPPRHRGRAARGPRRDRRQAGRDRDRRGRHMEPASVAAAVEVRRSGASAPRSGVSCIVERCHLRRGRACALVSVR